MDVIVYKPKDKRIDTIKKFAIDFTLVDKLFSKLTKCFENNSDKMRLALERLLELFQVEFSS